MNRKLVFSSVVIFFAVLGMIGFTATPAVAVKEFKDAFRARYVKPDSRVANDVALANAFSKASCGVCHAGNEDKKIRNAYGKQLAKLLSKEDKKNMAKIQNALDAVAKLKSNPSDPASPTFGENIARGKLPASK